MFKRLLSLLLVITLFATYAYAEETEPAATAEPMIQTIGLSDLMTEKLNVKSEEKLLLDSEETEGNRVLQTSLSGTHLVLSFIADETITDEIWNDVAADLMTRFASFDWSDPQALVNSVSVLSAAPAAGAEVPLWQTESLKPLYVKAENPYYPELSMGVNGDMTQKLQQKLIETGFLTDKADGYFGKNTLSAVNSVREYMNNLLKNLAAEDEYTEAELLPADIVSPELLFYLLGNEFKAYTGDMVTAESSTDEIKRMQRRLIAFGCLTGSADGIFGDNTARGIRVFQYANGLNESGIADANTLDLLFGTEGKMPAHPIMAPGSEGDEVEKLQERLLYSGFSTVDPDGKFQNGTKTAVENLQNYFRALEKEEYLANLKSSTAPANPDNTDTETAGTPEEEIEIEYTTVMNGIADPMMLDRFYADNFALKPAPMSKGAKGEDVKRVQRMLQYLEYLYTSPDGDFGSATEKAVTTFQRRNNLEETGICDQATIDLMFSPEAKKALKPYVLKVSTEKQRVYAYAPDANEEYTILVRTMKCSTGKNDTPTPKGTYQAYTGPGRRWHYFEKFKCWAQYAWHITGDILFHSVIYYEKEGKVQSSTVSNLGRKASHGCVRLSVEDAKWIWNNCPKYTKVIIY